MSREVLEALTRADLIRDGHVQTHRLDALKARDITGIAEQVAEISKTETADVSNAPLAHAASVSLGAGRHPCSGMECRTARASELARFAVLYSDGVYIRNFLADFLIDHSPVRRNSTATVKSFRADLHILAEISPLLEAGLIQLALPPTKHCPHCLAKRAFGDDAADKYDREYDRLVELLLERTSLVIERHDRRFRLHLRGPADLLVHDRNYSQHAWPEELKGRNDLKSRVQRLGRVELDRKLRERFGLHKTLATEIFFSLLFEIAVTQATGTSYLTERPVHIQLLNALSDDPELAERNHVVEEHLTSLVPFAADVPIDKLIELRRRESDAFVRYRHSLNSAIGAVAAEKKALTTMRARQIHADVIAPELAKLDQKVAAAKRELVKSSLVEAGTWVGAITFGMYAGLLPTELAVAAQALGLTKVIADTSRSALGRARTVESIRQEDLYFLWQVRRASRE